MAKAIVEYLVKSMVDKPEQVRIEEKKDNNKVMLEIHLDKNDLGKVIGKNGKTIKSIRVIVSLLSPERNVFVDVAN